MKTKEEIKENEENKVKTVEANQDIEIKTDKADNNKKHKKPITIFGISIWRILAYFIIYSFVGFVIETTYGAVRKGLVESRQSFLYGPFCSIYGIGACVMIVCLQKFKKSHNLLFIGGAILGSAVEYIISLIGELIFNIRWWDYSDLPFNINGRICVAFSFFWGVLAMYLLGSFNPKIDKLIDKLKQKIHNINLWKHVIFFATWILLLDCLLTGVALEFFKVRKVEEYNLNVSDREHITEKYHQIYDNPRLSKFIYKFWNDDKMIITFPNLKIPDKDGNIIYFDSLCPGCKRYYFKIYEKYNK